MGSHIFATENIVNQEKLASSMEKQPNDNAASSMEQNDSTVREMTELKDELEKQQAAEREDILATLAAYGGTKLLKYGASKLKGYVYKKGKRFLGGGRRRRRRRRRRSSRRRRSRRSKRRGRAGRAAAAIRAMKAAIKALKVAIKAMR